MLEEGILDTSFTPLVEEGYACLPLKRRSKCVLKYGVLLSGLKFRRKKRVNPINMIRDEACIPPEMKHLLPKRWKIIGKIVVLRIPEKLMAYREEVGRAYARVLHATGVIHINSITGEFRKPDTVLLYGKDTLTLHKENGVRFRLDLSKVMFSKGNTFERQRLIHLVKNGECILDMFAGIGYFSLPIAVHARPSVVYACEKDPVSFEFLRENIRLNHVEHIVKPVLADAKVFFPEVKCDRIIMGYIPEKGEWIDDRVAPWGFLDTAISNLSESPGATIHLHTLEKRSAPPFTGVKNLKVVNHRYVKSYAPGIWHAVYDLMREP